MKDTSLRIKVEKRRNSITYLVEDSTKQEYLVVNGIVRLSIIFWLRLPIVAVIVTIHWLKKKMSFRRKKSQHKKVRKYIKPIMNKISSFWLYDNGKLHILLIHVPDDHFHVSWKSYMRIHIFNCGLLWHEKNLMVVYRWSGQPW